MTTDAGRVKVLVVEDEALISEFIQIVLEDTGRCDVVGSAETGPEALAVAGTARPDVALVDVTLRGPMDGLALAARLRDLLPGIRIIFATGSHDPATRARIDAFAPAGILRKPFLADHLVRLIDTLDA